jgi:hypothetical protein
MREYGKRDPSSHRTPEQIRAMDRGYNARPDIQRMREERNQARAYMKKKVGAKALEGKDVGHRRMVIHGGTNAPSNLEIQTQHSNRGWRRNT